MEDVRFVHSSTQTLFDYIYIIVRIGWCHLFTLLRSHVVTTTGWLRSRVSKWYLPGTSSDLYNVGENRSRLFSIFLNFHPPLCYESKSTYVKESCGRLSLSHRMVRFHPFSFFRPFFPKEMTCLREHMHNPFLLLPH